MRRYAVTLTLGVNAKDEEEAEAEFYKLVSSGAYDSDRLEIEDITRTEKEIMHKEKGDIQIECEEIR